MTRTAAERKERRKTMEAVAELARKARHDRRFNAGERLARKEANAARAEIKLIEKLERLGKGNEARRLAREAEAKLKEEGALQVT